MLQPSVPPGSASKSRSATIRIKAGGGRPMTAPACRRDVYHNQVGLKFHCRARDAMASACSGQSCSVAGSKSAPFGQTRV